MNKGLIIGGIAVLAIGGAGYYFYKKNKAESEENAETKSVSFSASTTPNTEETADEKESETADEGVNGILGIGAFSTSRGEMLRTRYNDERTGLII